MDSYWQLAGRLKAHARLIVFALFFAAISAGGLGAGLLAIEPVLSTIFEAEDHRGLPQFAEEFNAKLESVKWVSFQIPAQTVASLPEGSYSAIFAIMIALGALTLIGGVANFLHQYLAITAVQHTIADIREVLFAKVVHMPLRDAVATGSLDRVSRIIGDTEQLSQGFTAMLSKAMAQITKGAIAFLVALVINWQLTMAAVVVAPALYLVIRKLGKRIRRASRKMMSGQADLLRAATEVTQGLRVVKVHTTEGDETDRFAVHNRAVLAQQLKVRTARALASPLIEVLTMFAMGALVLIASKLILDGHLEKEPFLAVLIALGVSGSSLKPLTGLINSIQQSAAAADRITEVLGEPAEPGRENDNPALPRHAKSITFDSVRVRYPGAETDAIDGVSLEIAAGQTVAFVGPNGSGKTTLLSLVPRLFDPDSGRVLIDGTDLTGVQIKTLRDQIGVVTQETVLFRRSVRDNVAYGSPDATDEQIREALAQARATDFVSRMPQGLATEVGEQGLTLSGGQRQRLAIARAILRNPAILILDEATSMIDADSENQIAAAIADFAKGRTSLVVAHRLSTVVNADRIVVLDAGKVVDSGTHDELLARCAVYQTLARHQLVPSGV
ncbi:MAG: subfamily B ATP-binding cassette protein MsbA [Phycisphaerales bacterium]|jgi:subfamily B ATP-binding cassette protein MsbA